MKLTKRNGMKKVSLALAAICAMGFSVTGVAPAQGATPQAASSHVAKAAASGLEASSYYAEATIGQPLTLKVTYNGRALDGSLVSWTTSNSAIATVRNGVVTGYKTGMVILTGTYKGDSIRIRASVIQDPVLEASSTSVSLKKGETTPISLTYGNKTLSSLDANWSSSNEAVATVKRGEITAKANGTAVITVTYKGKAVKIDVKVSGNPSGRLEANESNLSLKKGETKTIKLTYDAEKLAGSKATWKTSKSSVATISDGVVTAKAKGTATITAEYKGYKVEIEVSVDNGSSALLEANETKWKLKKGQEETISLKYNGEKLKGSKAEWKTSQSSVATVDDTGVVTAKKKGTATITATYKGQKVEIEVTVDDKGKNQLEAGNRSLRLAKGEEKTIALTYAGTKLSGSQASWSTSKSSVATVSMSGKVKAKAKGTATITAKYKGEEVTIKVTVN
ncbi:Ig-like domain-containing protein [Brevibacillus sp. SAFN-007a]|uniref:Ig-like domain-containing protein n=1 Tax=Brevibacillus sp. SAFN-007a TaxID=3436862 RepID=UPI003F7E9A31